MKYADSIHDDSYQLGLEFQDYVIDELRERFGIMIQAYSSKSYQYERGENPQGWEIKLDNRCTDSKRLSIEVAEKTKKDDAAPWIPSGICRDDNTLFYIQGNKARFYLFMKKHLCMIHKRESTNVEEKHGTIKTFYISFKLADEIGICVECRGHDG